MVQLHCLWEARAKPPHAVGLRHRVWDAMISLVCQACALAKMTQPIQQPPVQSIHLCSTQ